ncbi:Pentatricopeptide repeat-containing protein [Camellia lanceoleosa]|uniref:Pentatricopeptide repeat-containing protein n=1 Tax=Camellia lanceoleosa TaxID=1840588 RepID=A0ACC0FAF6_9ERIC|nr:Pentatricopeptide repeat-containing protein [Camellia lanceoleosa]
MIYLWNLKLRKSNEDGFFTETLQIYSSMLRHSSNAYFGNNFTFPLVLKACSNLRSIRDGTILHSLTFLIGGGLHSDVFVQTSLIDMYSKCSDLPSSRRVFDEMPQRNLVSWNSIISAYSLHLHINHSFSLFKNMLFLGLEPTSATFLTILSSGLGLGLGQGLSLHCYIIKLGLLHSDLPISNSVMSMYVRFGQLDDAQRIFYSSFQSERSIVSWTTLLGRCATAGYVAPAFHIFNQMRRQSVKPDCIALVNIISGCAQAGDLQLASSVHSLVLKSGCGCDIVHDDHNHPIDNLLVSMYAKCSDLVSARNVFDRVREKSVFLWTSMISGYTHFGNPEEAVNLFKELLRTNTRPNEITIATVLSACADLGSPSMGVEIEEYILQHQQHSGGCLASNLHVLASLIHMYCKCGNVEKAKQVFERVSKKDLAAWSSMINGYAIHGMGEEALSLFHKMRSEEGIEPDAVVYTSILMACSHSGLVEDGLEYFKSMKRNLKVEPSIEHYSCIVDLLGRAGYLDLALKSIQEMPVQVQDQVWAPLLSACRKHHNIEIGEFAAKKLLDLNHGSGSNSNYVAIANFYTSVGKWKEAAIVRRLIDKDDQGEGRSVKEPGWSQIEIDGSLHVFTAGDRSHHQSSDIYAKIKQLHALSF